MHNPSITIQGVTEPFELQLARGHIEGHKQVFVWGYNASLDANTEETIWTYGGILQHPSAATQMTVSSSSANDAAAGTGARAVLVEGLDADYNEASELVTLNGQTAVTTANSYLRIQSLTVATVGTPGPTGANAGQIFIGTGTVTAGQPATVYGHIATGEGRSLTAHWTVPARHKAYIISGGVSSGLDTSSHAIVGRLKLHTEAGVAMTAAAVSFANSSVDFDFAYPIAVPEKTCVSATAKSNKAGINSSANFQIVYLEEDPL
jgi:hypothetical protein